MSLWYESLAIDLYDCGENQQERARCMLSHLSMPVPRCWWERALKTGLVDDTHVSVLRESLVAISKVVDLESLNCGVLVVVAFDEAAPRTIRRPS
jgi:hypothetical protein